MRNYFSPHSIVMMVIHLFGGTIKYRSDRHFFVVFYDRFYTERFEMVHDLLEDHPQVLVEEVEDSPEAMLHIIMRENRDS